MDLLDFEFLKNNLNTHGLNGSDSSLGNLFLLQERYKINLLLQNNLLLRYFDFSESIHGYAFPLTLKTSNQDYLQEFINQITNKEVKDKIPLCLFSAEQKNEFDSFLKTSNSPYKIEWQTNPADSDYIYLQEKLSLLSGNKLQKKKNHISQFNRHFQNTSFIYFDKSNFSQALYDDFLLVAQNWINEHSQFEKESLLATYDSEMKSIKKALDNLVVLDFCGGILYIDLNPVAITLASKISDDILDIHFEKCLSSASKPGGYAVINNLFAKHSSSFKFINREEDLGIEGLRKAKLSYKPVQILEKYYGLLIKN